MTSLPHPDEIFEMVRASEVADSLQGRLYERIWDVIAEYGSYRDCCLAALWNRLTLRDRKELNSMAKLFY